MNVEQNNEWISQPDVCRCCLATSGAWDVTCSYISEAGDKEVYSEMLQECYGITLSYLTEWDSSRFVCGSCVGHLREASSFKKQVLRCEEQLVTFFTRTACTNEVQIKLEEIEETDQVAKLSPSDNDIITNREKRTENSKSCIQSRNRKRRNTVLKVKRKRREIDESDSDTPIAELTKKCLTSVKVNELCKGENTGLTDENTTNGSQAKPISERKRVIVTCDTVLKESTACPFRHFKSWFRCFYCPQDFMAIDSLRHHTINTHHNVTDELKKIKRYPRSLQIEISSLECRECQLSLTDVQNMCRHFVEVHGKVIYKECIADYKVNISPFSCHLCERQFHVFRTLTTHLNEHYANFICDVCGKSFIHSKRLKVHKRTHDLGQFPCSQCGKVLKTKSSKANHMETHSKRIIKCQICFKPMKHYNDRIKHMSEVHDITYKFKCPICPREYNIKHYLATHIRQTHGHKNKKCLECGMAFITNHGLKKHMFKHSGLKPYACRFCCKSYARSYTLKEHMRGHENERLLNTD